MDDVPRIAAVSVDGPTILTVAWRAGGRSRIDLADWLARPNPILDALSDPAVFARADVGGHGGLVTWDGDEGDLAIDAYHLKSIADEQTVIASPEALHPVDTGSNS